MNDLVLAAALLAGPPQAPEPEPTADHWPALQAALQHVAVDRELMSDNERHYLFARRDAFTGDLAILRDRNKALADAPPLADAERLPDRGSIAERLRFNRAFRRNLEARQALELDRAEELQEVIRETDDLFRIWDTAQDARCDYMTVVYRRMALVRLRLLIGETDYRAGRLPSNVPEWRLDER